LSVRRHLAWMGTAQAAGFAVQFCTSAIVARLLTPVEVGVFVLAMSITGILGIIQGLGLSGLIVREANLSERLKETAFSVNLVINTAVAIAVGLLSLGFGRFFPQTAVAPVLKVLTLIPLLGIFEFLPAAMTERQADFKTIALISLGRTVATQALILTLAFSGFSSMSFAYGQLAGALMSAVAYNLAARREIRWRLCFAGWRQVAVFGAQMLTINGVNMAASRFAEIVLARLAGLGALALFSRASSINNLAWENLHFVAARVLLVRLASLQKTGASLRNYYLHVVEVLTALLWPAFAGLAMVAGPFIYTVYGPQWTAATYPLVFLALSSAIWVSLTMSWELFVVCGETHQQTRIELIRTVVGTSLFAFGASAGGLPGAAASRLADAVFSLFIYRRPIERMSMTTLLDVYPIYRRSLFLTCIAVAPAGLVMFLHRGAATAPPGQVILSIAVGIGAWTVTLIATGHPLVAEARRVWRGKMTGSPAGE